MILVVAAAAINEVWQALGFQPPADVVAYIEQKEQKEQKLFDSRSLPRDAVAIFC